MDELKFASFSNEEMNNLDEMKEEVMCNNCGESHEVVYGVEVSSNGTRKPSKDLAFIKCDKNHKTYLVGIKGRLIKFNSPRKNNEKKYEVITLCGSTKFKDEFLRVQKKLTLQGYIVISVGLFGHSGDDEASNDDIKEMLDDMHKKKIDMADGIFVINKNGYIGSSTRSEIDYAVDSGKFVMYLEEI